MNKKKTFERSAMDFYRGGDRQQVFGWGKKNLGKHDIQNIYIHAFEFHMKKEKKVLHFTKTVVYI